MTTPAALTTTFSAAPSCFTNTWLRGNPSANYYWYSLGPPNATAACYPPLWQSATTSFFSPGICPQSYTQACSSEIVVGGATTTSATCCPSGYACYTEVATNFPGQACFSKVLTPSTATITSTADSSTIIKTATLQTTDDVNAWGVMIQFQATDLVSIEPNVPAAVTSSTSAGGLSLTIATRPSTITTTRNTAVSSATSSAQPNHKTNVWIAVANGLAVAVAIFAIAALIYVYRIPRSRNRHNKMDNSENDPKELSFQQHELAASPSLHENPELEAGSATEKYELAAKVKSVISPHSPSCQQARDMLDGNNMGAPDWQALSSSVLRHEIGSSGNGR